MSFITLTLDNKKPQTVLVNLNSIRYFAEYDSTGKSEGRRYSVVYFSEKETLRVKETKQQILELLALPGQVARK